MWFSNIIFCYSYTRGDNRQAFFHIAGQLYMRRKHHHLRQPFSCQCNILQLLPDVLLQQFRRPTLGFCNIQIGFPRFFPRIWQLMAGMRNLEPMIIDCHFQMLPALVQKLNVCGEFGVCRLNRCVHDKLSVILLYVLFVLLGGVRVLPTIFRCKRTRLYCKTIILKVWIFIIHLFFYIC